MSEVFLIHEPDVEFDVFSSPSGYHGNGSNGGIEGNGGNGCNGCNGGNGSRNSNYGKTRHRKIPAGEMHHGEIYIYLDQIFLHDNRRWYKANIDDIINIQTNASKKQILIRFLDFEMILHCNDYTHLLALRDFLTLSQSMLPTNNFMIHTHNYEQDLAFLEGGNVH